MATSDIKKGPLYVDSTNNRVGIGTSSPSRKLELNNGGTGALVTFTDGVATNFTFKTDGSNVGTFGTEAGGTQLAFMVASSEKMRIDSSGNVMIGTTSSNVPFYVYNTGFTGGQGTANTYTVAQVQTSTNTSGLWFGGMSTETTAVIGTTTGSGNLAFQTYNGSSWGERMRIDSSGKVGIGVTPIVQLDVKASTELAGFQHTSGTGNIRFYNTSKSTTGYIQWNNSTVSYVTGSDYRLKENVTADWDATTRLKQLNPVRFNFIADADTTVDGFLAHEVQDIVPEAITGTKDEVDEDGNPVMQGIDQSKLVPLLCKTILELEARITALEAN